VGDGVVTTDCVVIGAGLLGMLTALELADAGLGVIVLDKSQPGAEASWAGGGILSPLYPWRYPVAVNLMARESQRLYPDLCEAMTQATGIDPQWTRSGLLITDPGDATTVNRWADAFGMPCSWLDADEARRIEPLLGISPGRSAWMPEVAQVRNPRLVKALRVRLAQQGVAIRPQCPAQGWKISGQRVDAVLTPRSAACYVVAGGSWSGELLADTGLQVPVEPVRGQMILFKGPPELVSRITLYRGHYAIPRRDGRVLFGSTMEHSGFLKQTTAAAREELLQAAAELLPRLAGLPVERHWAGLRPGSPNGTPLVGRLPGVDNLYMNAGHFRNGVVLAPASARLLANLLLQRPPVLDPDLYRPELFIK
jgi:glycine oxidase